MSVVTTQSEMVMSVPSMSNAPSLAGSLPITRATALVCTAARELNGGAMGARAIHRWTS